jgi:methyl-accepting chemotaxis protein
MKLLKPFFNWFVGLTVGARLRSAFGMVVGLTLVLGVYAVMSMATVNRASGELGNKWLPVVGQTAGIRAHILEFRDLEVRHTKAEDAGYMSEYEEKMAAVLKSIETKMGELTPLLGSQEESKLFENFKKIWAAYLAINKNVIALGRSGKQQDARDIGDGAAKMSNDESIESLDRLTAFSFENGKAAALMADSTYNRARTAMIALALLAVVIGIMMALIITRSLTRTLGGEPAYATSLTKEIAEGRLYVDISLRNGDTTSLLSGIRDMRNGLAGIVKEVRSRSDQIAAASNEIAHGNNNLSERTEQQASAIQLTAGSMEDLSGKVRQNAESAKAANRLAVSASAVAVRGGEVVGQVVETMKGINDSSRKIADIISVIDGIAFQTNILALNAAVEAARAGEQGRGFAVVASEVRSLAGRSAEAAKEIKTLIGASVTRVEQGTALVDQAGATMAEVVTSIRRVTDLMSEISAASIEQSQGVANVGVSIGQMDETTQQNAALVEEMAAAAGNLSTLAQELVETVAVFVLNSADAQNSYRRIPA